MYVLKRPHVDEFLQKMGELFECVLFTASLAKVGCVSTSLPYLSQKALRFSFNWFLFLPHSVCWPCGRPAGPVGGVSRSALQGILCFSQGKLRQRPQPAGPRAQKSNHHRQLTCLLHLPPWERSKLFSIHRYVRILTVFTHIVIVLLNVKMCQHLLLSVSARAGCQIFRISPLSVEVL